MRHFLDLVFTERAIRRAIGVAILGGLMSGVGWIKLSELFQQDTYLTADENTWTLWVETGALVAGLALLFVALGLILGRTPSRRSTETHEPAEPSRV